jgi:hypothetical protein
MHTKIIAIETEYGFRRRSFENKVQKVGVFLATTQTAINRPRFTTHPPQPHHKNTTPKNAHFPKPPSKTPVKTQKKAPATTGTFFSQTPKN